MTVVDDNITELAKLLRSGFQPSEMPKHRKEFQISRYVRPKLASGKKKSITRICTTDMMYSAIHLIEDGGDAPIHRHAGMDQIWMVLKGHAVFTDEHDREYRIEPMQSICVPRGKAYGYRKDGEEALLLMQVAALNTKAKKNTLKFLGAKTNAEVQDGSSAKTELFDAVEARID